MTKKQLIINVVPCLSWIDSIITRDIERTAYDYTIFVKCIVVGSGYILYDWSCFIIGIAFKWNVFLIQTRNIDVSHNLPIHQPAISETDFPNQVPSIDTISVLSLNNYATPAQDRLGQIDSLVTFKDSGLATDEQLKKISRALRRKEKKLTVKKMIRKDKENNGNDEVKLFSSLLHPMNVMRQNPTHSCEMDQGNDVIAQIAPANAGADG